MGGGGGGGGGSRRREGGGGGGGGREGGRGTRGRGGREKRDIGRGERSAMSSPGPVIVEGGKRLGGEVNAQFVVLFRGLARHPSPEHARGDGENMRLALHALRYGVQAAAGRPPKHQVTQHSTFRYVPVLRKGRDQGSRPEFFLQFGGSLEFRGSLVRHREVIGRGVTGGLVDVLGICKSFNQSIPKLCGCA